jgi:glycosyltransferase involved in cell wall biosynthesis
MKVSGFTFIRNAVKLDYPVVESITSILPVCDELIVVVGNSDDGTEALIRSIHSDKIKIIHSVWDDSLREGGQVLAVETDKAFAAISPDSDWAFYIQADEVVHEKHLPAIQKAMQRWKDDKTVDGLLFNYVHFYGTYNYIGDSRRWYRNEIRIVKNDKGIHSWKDAQGFRKNGEKLNVKKIDAEIYHYGWVKSPEKQQEKQKTFHKFWHSDETVQQMTGDGDAFDYTGIDSLTLFKGNHPQVMQNRVLSMNWSFEHNIREKKLSPKNRVMHWLEKLTGKRFFEYKNYRL